MQLCVVSDEVRRRRTGITYIDLSLTDLPASGGIPLALLKLTGLAYLSIAVNNLAGTISPHQASPLSS